MPGVVIDSSRAVHRDIGRGMREKVKCETWETWRCRREPNTA